MKNKILSYVKYILIGLGIIAFITPLFVTQISGVTVDVIFSNIFKTICVGLFILATIMECIELKINNKNQSIAPKLVIIACFLILIVVFWL
ncbi:MAG: hypothetical protein J6V40_03845 [Clostridia bacterium]|nr:hypothetical protein [Clostridia bacterium]